MPSIEQAREQAVRHFSAGELDQARTLCQQILQASPRDHSMLHLMAVIAVQGGRSNVAESFLRRAIDAFPSDALVHANLGSVLRNLGKLDESIASYEQALRLRGDNLEGLVGLARALILRSDLTRAETLCQTALRFQPAYAEGWHVLGDALRLQGRYSEAEPCFRKAAELNPANAESHNNLACTLQLLGKKSNAMDAYRKALALAPDYASAHSNIAVLFQERGMLDEAETHLRQAARLQPRLAEAMINLGGVLQLQSRLDEAMECFRAADALAPDSPVAATNLLLCMNYHPRFDPATLLAEHRKWGERFGKISDARISPAPAQSYAPITPSPGTPGEGWGEGSLAAVDKERPSPCPLPEYWERMIVQTPQSTAKPWDPAPDDAANSDRPLRVGYVSPDFSGHAISHFLTPLLANHDPRQVEVFCYAEQTATDEVTSLMKKFAKGWRSTVGVSDAAIAEVIRSDCIDILVDLAGHTSSNRLLVFPHRPARVQVTYLGYPNTTGLASIDYRITDAICDPPGEPPAHTEKLFRLPRAFCCFDYARKAPDPGPLPAQRAGFITFGSLHPLTRLNRGVLDTWCDILQAAPTARLMIFRNTLRGKIKDELFRYITGRGIAPQRLELAHQPPITGYMGVYNEIDISLDTFPWSGHTMACQSMWMGVPIITLRGNRFAGRMVASVVRHAGLPHLIANTREEYVHIAAELAGDTESLARLRAGLRQQMSGSILCDHKGFTEDIERAYRQMFEEWARGRSR